MIQPPPASTDGIPSTSAKNARTFSACGENTIACIPVITDVILAAAPAGWPTAGCRDTLAQTRRVVASGAISANGHGNVSVRVPGAREMYFTAGPSLRNHPASAVVRVGLDGTLLEGELPPIQGAVVAMHTAMYAENPEVGCVLHTHSPYATAYAVAHRRIE